jgi:hypothetical protein
MTGKEAVLKYVDKIKEAGKVSLKNIDFKTVAKGAGICALIAGASALIVSTFSKKSKDN